VDITIVTVTYGNRRHLLSRTLSASLEQGANRAIVVDNASAEPINAYLLKSFPGLTETLRMEENIGSAGGYCIGIAAALKRNAEFILLLDDDNLLEPGSLERLKDGYRSLLRKSSRDRLCVLGLRPDQMPGILRGIPHEDIGASGDTFFGFHVKDLPNKLVKRTFRRSLSAERIAEFLNHPVPLRTGPFGGMLFHRSLVERFGLPDSRFVLYVDDTEFSYRISSRGGQVWLLPSARIADMDQSWQVTESAGTAFDVWLCNGSARHAYYTARNWAYFQVHCRRHSWFLGVNRWAFLLILWITAKRRHASRRFQLLRSAIRSGESGLLGIHPEYPPGG
jgi:GT2 family glycosyltransferase